MKTEQRSILAILILLLARGPALYAADYFVNDTSTNGDVYCTAIGNDAHAGTNAAAPKLTIANLLAQVDLEPGDVVYVDTGSYSNFTASITTNSSGASGNPVSFIGSTNTATGTRLYPPYGSTGLTLRDGVQWLVFEHLSIVGGGTGLRIDSGCDNLVFRALVVRDTTGSPSVGYRAGISINNVGAVLFEQCGLIGNQYGLYVQSGFAAAIVFKNGVIYNNGSAGVSNPGGMNFRNTVFGGGVLFSGTGPSGSGEYNVFWNAVFGDSTAYGTLSEFEAAVGWSNNVYANPQFADPGNADFHPKSVVGRYEPGSGLWTTDAVHSVLIDLGDPADSWSTEPSPNGGRVNAGMYGDTPWASMSRADLWFLAKSFNDGGVLTGSVNRLAWDGGNWAGVQVDVQYAPSLSGPWSNIATAVQATDREVNWDVGSLSATAVFWRVVNAANPAQYDVSDQRVSVNNAPVYYYVNGDSLDNPVYCTAVGDDGNDGLTPGTPKRTVTSILTNYSLFGCSVVLIDAGAYSENQIAITGEDSGSEEVGACRFQGAGSDLSVFTVGSGRRGVLLTQNASFIDISGIALDGGNSSVYLSNGQRLSLCSNIFKNSVGSPGVGYNAAVSVLRSGSNSVANCVFRNNRTALYRGSSATISLDKNTFFGNTTVFSAFDGQIYNSVISGGVLFENGQPSALSDYNLFYGVDIPGYRSLREYQKAVGGWWHSSVADPLFADAANGDFHPKSQKGRWDPAALSWVYDPETSPLVDFGDPTADYANESPPNGSNVNAGAYGNTWQASRTPTNARLLVLSLTDGGTLEVPGDKVYWRAYNMPPGATVRIELSQDSGNTWLPVVTNISASAGEYAWMNTNYPSTFEARWRVVYEADTGVSDATDADFAFHNGPYTYYLNDESQDNDVYCTAAGNDGNSGTRDDDPMYSLKALLDAYELVPGDIIYVDTGHYVQSANATFTALDSGSTNEPIRVIGSPQGTVFDRGSSSSTAYGLSFNGTKHVEVSYLMVSGGGVGYQLNSATGIVLRNCAAQNQAYDGIASTNSYLDVMNGVFWANTGVAVRVSSGHVSVTNSILGAFGSAAYGYYVSSTNVLSANYNDIYTSDEGVAGYVVSLQRNLDSLSVWSKLTGLDAFSLSVDPQFASVTNSDFHLKTEVEDGRYIWGGGYSAEDTVTSPLIDAGDPASTFTNEPDYNGGRINMGMWGNTVQASKRERVDLALEAGSPSGGGGLSGNGAFHWVAYGENRSVETVKIEFSGDAGRTWQQIASGVPATDERYVWDTTLVSNTPAALWQVIGESDTNISSAVSNFFGIRNAPLTWYVNDGNLVGDMYCSAVGNATNWPATADAPLDSLAQVLAYYDVEPGDRIYVDTGVYTNEANVVIGRLAGGAVSSSVVIAGSTNLPAGGTQFIRSDSSSNNVGLTIASASYLSGSNLVLYAGYHGLLVSNAVGISWDGLTVMSNASDGVVVNVSSNVQLSRVLVSGGGGCGVQLSGSKAVRLERSILWSNALSAVVISNAQLSVRSSVLTVADYGYYLYQLIGAQSALDADQNDLILWGLAQAADVRGSRARTILDWQTKFTNDVRSLSHDPLFADYGLTGFHPCSQAGRYEPGTGSLTNDVVTSPLIDTGDPLAVYAAEPTPNGSRVNIGLYGNTAEASKSRTNGWYLALTCNDGGMLRGTNWIYWVAGGAATGDTVKLEYLDDGSNWVTFASGLPASPAEYQWNTTEPGIPLVINRTRWRVVSESDTNIVGETQNDFTLNNGKLTFYVNDSFTVDDVYCGVPGA
ncbi:MAG: hypothetical protein PHP44_14405, partial [Kiritimatiellae bacterium]|nr:hypothetical protein [Kiritimatiellia bacterium]